MDAYFSAMRTEIEAEGGTVEKFIGDAVMAAFGAPLAHEDDPARALRAGLRMLARLPDVNRDLEPAYGVRLQIRIGVHSGEVLAAVDPEPGEAMVTGDAVNAAARLQTAAEPGELLASERTVAAARGFVVEDRGSFELKGKQEGVRAFVVLEESGGPTRGLPGFHAPMVGRDTELDLLQSVYERAARERKPHLVTIYGEAGVGKSRLSREFLEWSSSRETAPITLAGRCLPYGDGITYWPLAEILKTHASILDSDPTDLAIEKVRKSGRDLLTLEVSADPSRATAALAYTIGLQDPDISFVDLDPKDVRAEVHAAWRSFFTALGERGPVVVVVEDIHWADHALLDLLEELTDRVAGPVLFLCPSRPDLIATRPGWGGGRRNTSSVALDPLSAEESDELIRALLAVDDLPPSVHDRILERAEGNPFFLEEIVRRLVDGGLIEHVGDRWRATEGIEEVEIPDTVQAVLAARIDLLEATDKRIAQAAAVVGRVFWPGPVAGLTGRRAGRSGRRAAQARGSRARVVSPGLVARGPARIHLQARPHSRRRVRVTPAEGACTGARHGCGLAGTHRRRPCGRVRRGTRVPLRDGRGTRTRCRSRNRPGASPIGARVAAAGVGRRPPPVRREESRAPRRGSAQLRDRPSRARRRADDARRGVLHRLPRRPRVAILQRGSDHAGLGRPAGRPTRRISRRPRVRRDDPVAGVDDVGPDRDRGPCGARPRVRERPARRQRGTDPPARGARRVALHVPDGPR